ncbi:phage portal protein [Polaribacter sp.]|uniref:phage portal protein n=1 Tax=Polaribacter sp. TaxID=1920175 RepID=UPI003F6ACFDE
MLLQAIQHNNSTRSALNLVGSNSFLNWIGGASTKNGTPVNTNSAKTLSAFYNGITILCNDYAKLPKSVIIKEGNTRTKDTSHPVNRLLNKRPNQYMSAFNYDSIMMQCAILKGNAYSEIIRNAVTGKVESRQFIDERLTPVTVKKFNGKLFYHFDGKVVEGKNIEHVIGFSENGITGIGVVAYAAKSLGVALSSQEFAEEYYASKGIGMGVMTSATKMDPDAKTRYAQAIENRLNSSSNYKVSVIDEASSFQHISLTPQESMFLETNKHAIGEVARWLNIPTHKLKDTENSNYSNMESLNIDYISNSVLPWSIKFKQEQVEKLFVESEKQRGYAVHHNSNSLLEADKKTQAAFLSTMIYAGVYTRNEVRSLLDLNEIDGLSEPLTAVNMQTLEQVDANLKKLQNE